MVTRYFDSNKDYTDVATWWSGHNWPIIPPDYLPKLGIIVEDDDFKYCCGWLYRTDSLIAWLEYVVTNPAAPMKRRSVAINLLIEELSDKAKQMGYGCIFTSAISGGLIRRFKKADFVVGDEGMTNLVRKF